MQCCSENEKSGRSEYLQPNQGLRTMKLVPGTLELMVEAKQSSVVHLGSVVFPFGKGESRCVAFSRLKKLEHHLASELVQGGFHLLWRVRRLLEEALKYRRAKVMQLACACEDLLLEEGGRCTWGMV